MASDSLELPSRGCVVVQVLQAKPLEAYRNTFANLALPLFAMSEPVPAKKAAIKDMSWTLWDRWVLEGDLTVQARAPPPFMHHRNSMDSNHLIRSSNRAPLCCDTPLLGHNTLTFHVSPKFAG